MSWYDWIRQGWNLFCPGRGVDCDVVGGLGCLSQGVENWRASNGNRWLLMTGKVSDRRFIEASPDINVDGIGDFVSHLSRICRERMGCFVVAGRCE